MMMDEQAVMEQTRYACKSDVIENTGSARGCEIKTIMVTMSAPYQSTQTFAHAPQTLQVIPPCLFQAIG